MSMHAGGSTRRRVNAGFREKSIVLESAITEYLRLKRSGVAVDVGEFCERYPDYRHSLRRLIDVEECLGDLAEIGDENWPAPGGLFLGYEILELLGAGSIARVFLASELKLGGRPVAIKVSPQGGYEAETLGKLRHPNIVEVYSVSHDEDSDLTAVCMPYRGSATLSDLLDFAYRTAEPPRRADIILEVSQRMALEESLGDGALELELPDRVLERGSFEDGVVHLGRQLASALQYAHDHGVLHRDLKPSNVLLAPSGRPMLLDFNLSYDEAQNVVHHGGTLPYMAPEQLLDSAAGEVMQESVIDARADIFSLGAIFYELLSNELPFGVPASDLGPRQAVQAQLAALERPLVPLRSLNPGIDRTLAAIIERCLDKDPARRFSTMSELEAALRGHFRWSRQFGRWARRRRRALLLTTGSCTALLASLSFYIATRPPYVEQQRSAGILALRDNQPELAIERFSLALQEDANDHAARRLRGIAYQLHGDHERAVEDFAPLAGRDPELLERRGDSLLMLGRHQEAFFSFARAATANDRSGALQRKLAFASFLMKQHVVPTRYLQAALDLAPDDYRNYLLRAICVAQVEGEHREKLRNAIQDALRASELAPADPVVQFEVAQLLAKAAPQFPELLPDTKVHLERVVRLGWSRGTIEASSSFASLAKEVWFQEMLTHCRPVDPNPRPTLKELIVTLLPPSG